MNKPIQYVICREWYESACVKFTEYLSNFLHLEIVDHELTFPNNFHIVPRVKVHVGYKSGFSSVIYVITFQEDHVLFDDNLVEYANPAVFDVLDEYVRGLFCRVKTTV